MNTQVLILVGLLLVAGMLFIKYVYWTIGKDLQEYARYESDPQARSEKISELGELIARGSGGKEALLQRANLYCYDENYAAAAVDLRAYLALAGEDSEGWAELGQCCILINEIEEAYEAAKKAIELDPEYADYRRLMIRCELLLARFDDAGATLRKWKELDGKRLRRKDAQQFSQQFPGIEKHADYSIGVYEAALLQSLGQKDQARVLIDSLKEQYPQELGYLLENDAALSGVKGEDV